MPGLKPLTAAVIVAVCAIVQGVQGANPWFCQSYDCPSFTSEDRGGYEIREYQETKWVATSINSRNPDPNWWERREMFGKLFDYISGENAKEEEIDMTVPVLTKVETDGPGYKITMMFYLTSANPPAPTEEDVVIVTKAAGTVFVRSFPSWFWPRSSRYRDEARQMKIVLDDGSLYDDNIYYKAGYNSPADFFKRKQHEVWIEKSNN